MKRNYALIFLIGFLAFMSLTGITLAASSPAIDWQVISGGGAPASGTSDLGESITIHDTFGQPIIGVSSGNIVYLSSGYWYGELGPIESMYIYLPLILKP